MKIIQEIKNKGIICFVLIQFIKVVPQGIHISEQLENLKHQEVSQQSKNDRKQIKMSFIQDVRTKGIVWKDYSEEIESNFFPLAFHV